MNENAIKMARLMVGCKDRTCEDCLSQSKKLFGDNKCALIEYAEVLDKADYRKQSEKVKEFAGNLKEECHKAIAHNYTAMDNRKKADEMWYICCGQNEGLNFVLKTINELAEQYGKEEK